MLLTSVPTPFPSLILSFDYELQVSCDCVCLNVCVCVCMFPQLKYSITWDQVTAEPRKEPAILQGRWDTAD